MEKVGNFNVDILVNGLFCILCLSIILFFVIGGCISVKRARFKKEILIAISDARSLGVPLETYYGDHSRYPDMRDDCQLPTDLTTPVEYIASKDFSRIQKNHKQKPLHYYFLKKSNMWLIQYCERDYDYDLPAKFLIQAAERDRKWILDKLVEYKYDPTNGTKSSGDRFYYRH